MDCRGTAVCALIVAGRTRTPRLLQHSGKQDERHTYPCLGNARQAGRRATGTGVSRNGEADQ